MLIIQNTAKSDHLNDDFLKDGPFPTFLKLNFGLFSIKYGRMDKIRTADL